MARLPLNKSSLHHESNRLKTFERFLPSLDLKRRQLIAERARAEQQCRATRAEVEQARARIAGKLPMLATPRIELTGLARVAAVNTGEENLLGTRLPVLRGVEIELASYPLLGTPHWVDAVATGLREVLTLLVRLHVEQQRLALLEQAVLKITQRVNLFDKVLIPRTRANIRRIGIFLADNERAAVVRAKIAKDKHAGGEA